MSAPRLSEYTPLELVTGTFLIALAVLSGYLLYSFVGTFVCGVFFYYATRPLYRRLKPYLGDSTIAALTTICAFLLPVVVLFGYAIVEGFRELQTFAGFNSFVTTIAPYLQPYLNLSTTLDTLASSPTQFAQTETIRGLVSIMLGYIGFFGTAFIHLLVMLIFTFLLLREDTKLREYATSHLPIDTAVSKFFRDVDTDLKHVYFGNIVNVFIAGIISALAYNVLAYFAPATYTVPMPTVFGLIIGAASLIPVIGMKLVYFPITGFLLLQTFINGDPVDLWFPVTFFMVSVVVVDMVPDFLLRPYVSGRNVHVVGVMISYIIGTLAFGWYGLFLGPLLFVVFIHVMKTLVPAMVQSETYYALTTPPGEDPGLNTTDDAEVVTPNDETLDSEHSTEDTDDTEKSGE